MLPASKWLWRKCDLLYAAHEVETQELVFLLKTTKVLPEGKRIHALAVSFCKAKNIYLENLIIEMYGKYGSLRDAFEIFDRMFLRNVFSWVIIIGAFARHGQALFARKVFDSIPAKNVVCWNSMITAYSQNGYGKEALQIFEDMKLQRIVADKVTFVSLLSGCAQLVLGEGKRIHSCVIACGFESDEKVANAVINMYSKCGNIKDAEGVFDIMLHRDVISWTAMICMYTKHTDGRSALQIFQEMAIEGVVPNKISVLNAIDACTCLMLISEAKRMNAYILKSELDFDLVVANALVNMYGKCNSLKDAHMIFSKTPSQNLMSWNALTSAYAQNDNAKAALQLFNMMQLEGMLPDNVTFVSVLDACANGRDLAKGKFMHACTNGKIGMDSTVGNALVYMYGRCHSLDDAKRLFQRMSEHNVVSWNAIIATCIEVGQHAESFLLFNQMASETMPPDTITYVSMLSACAGLADLDAGKVLHVHILRNKYDLNGIVGNALIHMYGKCGSLVEALSTFNKIKKRNTITWNALLMSIVHNSYGTEVLKYFKKMQLEHVSPNKITMLTILSGCCNSGMTDEGYHMFSVISLFHMVVTSEQHGCVVDLLGRAGWIYEAADFILNMVCEPTAIAWTAFLDACAVYGETEVAKHATQYVLELDPEEAASYVLISNLYAADTRWRETVETFGYSGPVECLQCVKNQTMGTRSSEHNSHVHYSFTNILNFVDPLYLTIFCFSIYNNVVIGSIINQGNKLLIFILSFRN